MQKEYGFGNSYVYFIEENGTTRIFPKTSIMEIRAFIWDTNFTVTVVLVLGNGTIYTVFSKKFDNREDAETELKNQLNYIYDFYDT